MRLIEEGEVESDIPRIVVWFLDGSQSYIVAEQWPQLKTAFLNGDTFFIGNDLVGDEMVIKLREVNALGLASTAGIARAKILNETKKQRRFSDDAS